MIKKTNITIENLQKLNINELNKLVQFLEIEGYYNQAMNRTLRYEKEVMNKISEQCNIFHMIDVLENRKILNGMFKTPDNLEWFTTTNNDYEGMESKCYSELCDALFNTILENLD